MILRDGPHTCSFPFGGGHKQCGQALVRTHLSALPLGLDKNRIRPLESRQIKPDPTALPSSQPVPSSSPLSLGPSATPSPSPLSGSFSGSPPSVSTLSYHYECGNKHQKHYWQTTSRLDRPENVQCPGKSVFGATCNAILTYLPGGSILGYTYTPLDPVTVRRLATVSTHVFASPSSSAFAFTSPAPVRPEARSQAELTKILVDSRQVSFLCRDGTFRETPVPPTSKRAANEYVEEPGLCKAGPLLFLSEGSVAFVVGRTEVGDLGRSAGRFQTNPFIAGTVTYPDFVVCQGSYPYAVELKTPRTSTMEAYLGAGFYDPDTGSLFKSRTVREEIEARARILPDEYYQMLAFDLFNITEAFDASVRSIQAEITEGRHRDFWGRIKGFLFIEQSGAVRTFSKDTLLAHGRAQPTLGFVLVKGVQLQTTTTTASASDDDELATSILHKIEHGIPRSSEERRFLRDKLQAMRIYGNTDYIPTVLESLSALTRLSLERKV
ncbi:MAG TPA: hypothetical protein VNM67_14670 [Thermoanaerobaculia bacterium]|jgi:hypothetical protein|nr:hypothetical protein [Thermoanaerobaculia bacterium]